jgi:phage terminase Nu1 subunit (DNA packaging protein)
VGPRSEQLRGVVVRLPSTRRILLSKKQLAAELGRSTRWVELRMREGLPVQPRRCAGEHARFDLDEVRQWLDARTGQTIGPKLEERVARLEQELARLAAALNREEARSGDPQAR